MVMYEHNGLPFHSYLSTADMMIVEPAKLDEEEDVKTQMWSLRSRRRALEQWSKIVAQLKR
ncbi:hypothetical protein PHLCEN_2v6169 [Hermanssonia centrifuga]|uniref:Uncharacterized protein n=1 Tax=Hermanssonia centrifuga TaxID=98765 RepID=A0A2R6P050_9APHY|nr:hypothetical protein PHLCEN_2v6169 [Hermanssonia centrifuga]